MSVNKHNKANINRARRRNETALAASGELREEAAPDVSSSRVGIESLSFP
jgi:hypothetical protein